MFAEMCKTRASVATCMFIVKQTNIKQSYVCALFDTPLGTV